MKRWALLLAALLASQAHAQNKPLLDLRAAPGPPAAGSGAGALALADQLAAQATTLEQSARAGPRAQAALRRLARELLVSGEALGPAGSARIVMGRTLARSLPELDAFIAGANDDPMLHAVLADISSARQQMNSSQADPDLVLRDGLALLSHMAGPAPGVGGWIDLHPTADPPPLADRIDTLAKRPGVSPEAVEVLRAMDVAATESADWPAFAAAGSRHRRLVLDAAASFEPAPAWLPEPARRILGERFSHAVVGLSKQDSRNESLATFRRLVALARLIRLAESLDDNPAGKRIRAAVAQAVSIPAAEADARTADAIVEVLQLALSRSSWPDEKRLARQFRPPLRVFLATARQTEQQMLASLPEVLRRPEAMTDPGTLAAITAHRRAVADVEGLLAVAAAFAAPGEGEPVVDKPWTTAANRVLKLSQDLGSAKADQRDAALASLRGLFDTVSRCWKLPGEDELRDAVKAEAGKPLPERANPWAALSGGREAALLGELTDRRAGWLFDWEKGISAGSDGRRLETLRTVLALLQDAAPLVRPGEDYARLIAWPGWELSSATFRALATGLESQGAEAVRLLLAGDSDQARATVEKARGEFAAAILGARLCREAARRGIAPITDARAALRELTAGGPIQGRSWLGAETKLLDDVCRYGEEILPQRKLGAKDKADALQRYVNAKAAEALDHLDRLK